MTITLDIRSIIAGLVLGFVVTALVAAAGAGVVQQPGRFRLSVSDVGGGLARAYLLDTQTGKVLVDVEPSSQSSYGPGANVLFDSQVK